MKRLTQNDFYVDNVQKRNPDPNAPQQKVLRTSQKGIIFTFFHLDDEACDNCKLLKPEFMKLPNIIPQINYALVDLKAYPGIAKKTIGTVAPITYVPYLIVFVDGRPFLRYDGGKSSTEMAQFLRELLNNIPKDVLQRSTSESKNNTKFNEEVPIYPAGGIPYNVVCDKNSGVCYLSFDELMTKKK